MDKSATVEGSLVLELIPWGEIGSLGESLPQFEEVGKIIYD